MLPFLLEGSFFLSRTCQVASMALLHSGRNVCLPWAWYLPASGKLAVVQEFPGAHDAYSYRSVGWPGVMALAAVVVVVQRVLMDVAGFAYYRTALSCDAA
ncbi:hypothetical protein Agub_g11147 [Astrephomene gubernaculifera]|uniref:Uncharacterized protein n=1 Tax=Astrephomene gubernaculifera TaxID=47775 RepID=A0AAD3HQE8_9CHLO|nr:hypothetical protein Agub_g11147 [Astrephomene gubernaculifera]